MASSLDQISVRLATSARGLAKRSRRASLFVKVALLGLGSTVVAIAQFSDFGKDGPSSAQIAGIIAAIVVAAGAVFVVLTEEDAGSQLALAHDAIEKARDVEAAYESVGELYAEMDRLIYLYQAQSLMRGALEAIAVSSHSEESAARSVMQSAQRLLPIVLAFAQADQWTVGVYQAIPSDELGKADLKCIAHKRAIECDAKEARVWKEGTGIAGVAYANATEIVVPDLQSEGMRSVFGTAANESRAYDQERYRSMVSIPIKVQGLKRPWGVVNATNDKAGHFSAAASDGVRPDEGARALANMVALAVAIVRSRPARSEGSDSHAGTS